MIQVLLADNFSTETTVVSNPALYLSTITSNTPTHFHSNATQSVTVIDFTFYHEESKKMKNVEKLSIISQLGPNWDNYGAEPFSPKLLENCHYIIANIIRQPSIFPTGRKSIQFEYEKENGEYLEFEVFEDKVEIFKVLDNGQEIEDEFDLDLTKINESVVSFYE